MATDDEDDDCEEIGADFMVHDEPAISVNVRETSKKKRTRESKKSTVQKETQDTRSMH